MTTDDILAAVGGRRVVGGDPIAVRGVSIDSRCCKAGDLFVALGGERFDGHAFLTQAARGGCVAAMVSLDAELSGETVGLFPAGVIGVAETRRALGQLAGFYRGVIAATVVAVTGSNGKTTVKRMIHHILSTRLKGSCSPKSFNNAVGVPLTLLAVEPSDEYVICELGSNAPGEIDALAKIARPDLAVITSVARTHLEKLGDLRGVAAEKASILAHLPDEGAAVIFADSECLDRAVRGCECPLVRFGASERSDLRLTGYAPTGRGGKFQVDGGDWVELGLAGRHNALNALAAIAVAQRMGFDLDAAAEALRDFRGIEMRLQRVECGGVALINDAYNANPASVLAAADVLCETPGDRKVMIVGDMRELGDSARALHEEVGRSVAGRKVDLLIGVGSLGRYIARSASEAGAATETFDSVEDACAEVARLLRPGDVVLVKGSRSMEMERLVEPIRNAFSTDAKKG